MRGSLTCSRGMILAHLDLDAFFAAVEELEHPELRAKPLIVGGDPQGRGVVATANYVARALRDPLGDERGRGGAPLPAGGVRAAAPQPLPRVLAPRVVDRARHRPDGRADRRSTRAISTSARSRRDFLQARVVAEALQTAVRAGDEPHVLARRRAVQGGREDRKRRAQAGRADRRRPRPGADVPRAVRRAPAARRRAEGGAAAPRRRRRHDRRRSRRSPTTTCAGSCPGASARSCATARAESTRAGSTRRSSASRSRVENTFERDLRRPRAAARRAARHGERGGRPSARDAARPRAR